jgi:hypothetical protein
MSALQTLVTLVLGVVLRRLSHHLLRVGTSRTPGKGAVSKCTPDTLLDTDGFLIPFRKKVSCFV